MSSRIEQIIEEIEEYIDSCKFQPLSTSKIVVNREDEKPEALNQLMDMLKMSLFIMIIQKDYYLDI